MKKIIVLGWLWLGVHAVVFSMNPIEKFKSVKNIFFTHESDFTQLSGEEVFQILEREDLEIDSENSVLYAILFWTFSDPLKTLERKKHLPKLMTAVRFPYLEKPYISDILPNLSSWFPDNKAFIEEVHELACDCHEMEFAQSDELTKKLGQQQLKPHRSVASSNIFTIKIEFTNISKLREGERYYSKPIAAHGYSFFYLIKQLQNANQQQDSPNNLSIGGFLRCIPPQQGREGPCITNHHRLPVRITTAINTRDGQTRRFIPLKCLFTDPCMAIGGKLGLDTSGESLANLADWPIIIDDAMTICVSIEFLPTEEDCVDPINRRDIIQPCR